MENRIDINRFYQGLDEKLRQKDAGATALYMENWLAQAEMLGDPAGIVAVCNELGGLCRVTGQEERAKQLYEKALQQLRSISQKDSENYATTLINYGDVYIQTGEYDQALNTFAEARKILDRLGMSGDYRMAALCNNISMVYRHFGEYDKAEEALGRAFLIIKSMGDRRSELATTYINLGELQTRQGKLLMAEESFLEACRIFDAEGGGSVHYSAACAGLAQAYYLSGKNQKARDLYTKAMGLVERDFGRTPAYYTIKNAMERIPG